NGRLYQVRILWTYKGFPADVHSDSHSSCVDVCGVLKVEIQVVFNSVVQCDKCWVGW
ncbi:hypothetical protein MKX03_013676, partial [Papaver bracteatum]